MRDTMENIKQRVRESGSLEDRLSKCREIIGDLCSKGRSPKMSIPVKETDEDIFISTTIMDAQDKCAELERQVKDLNKCSYMGAMRDCPTHGESEQLKLLKQENQILIEELKEARAENSRFGMGA